MTCQKPIRRRSITSATCGSHSPGYDEARRRALLVPSGRRGARVLGIVQPTARLAAVCLLPVALSASVGCGRPAPPRENRVHLAVPPAGPVLMFVSVASDETFERLSVASLRA